MVTTDEVIGTIGLSLSPPVNKKKCIFSRLFRLRAAKRSTKRSKRLRLRQREAKRHTVHV